jgi:phosphoglycolate phosphatase
MSRFLLVFDLDGTLVDSAPDLRAALNQLLRERGHPALSLSQVKRMVGDGAPAMVARALAASGGDPADAAGALPRFLKIYEANAVRLTRPYPQGAGDAGNPAPAGLPYRDLHEQTAAGDDRGGRWPRSQRAVRRDRRRRSLPS